MLLRLRHALILLLFVFLPFHALFVTAGTRVLLGPNHPPLLWLALWKEFLLIVIMTLGIAEIAPPLCRRIYQYTSILMCLPRSLRRVRWTGDAPTALVAAIVLLALIVAALHGQSLSDLTFAFGFRYTLLPLIFFLLLRSLPWDREWIERRLLKALMVVGGIVAAYGVVTFFLPQSFFTALGYSDAHSLYAPDSPLAAFQKISGTGIRRIQSTFAGPNQLGMWLLVPWSIVLASLGKTKGKGQKSKEQEKRKKNSFIFCVVSFAFFLFTFALFLTFSRSAWIAAFVIAVVACSVMLGGRARTAALTVIIGATVVAVVLVSTISPQLLRRGISNRHHLERARQGIVAMVEKPLGHGLGTAGPASNRVSDPCVYFDEGADIGWAKERPDLCLFVAGAQVQPLATEKTCTCPVLPENWYLQIGYELGMAGFVLFVSMVLTLIFQLFQYSSIPIFGQYTTRLTVALLFLGLSIAALFLHAFEDSAVAYTVWGLAGIALSRSGSFTSNPRAAAPAA